MPIVIGGNIVDVNAAAAQQQAQKVAPVVPTPSVSIEEVRKAAEIQSGRVASRKVAPAHPRIQFDPYDHLVVVDGKAKKIGKQSKYLLDMLTIDE
jgi:isopentenyl diphosphate isomerase/L-lactate dehydrogenase-like FMN-dependent dehydrogenase